MSEAQLNEIFLKNAKSNKRILIFKPYKIMWQGKFKQDTWVWVLSSACSKYEDKKELVKWYPNF